MVVESIALHSAQVQTSALPRTHCENSGRLSCASVFIGHKKGIVIGPTSREFLKTK